MAKKADKKKIPTTTQGTIKIDTEATDFFESVARIIEQARKLVGRAADLTMCVTFFSVGRMIVEHEQGGETHAEYGKRQINELAEYLNKKFTKGFSAVNLKNARKFYLTYKDTIGKKSLSIMQEYSDNQKRQTLSAQLKINTKEEVDSSIAIDSEGFELLKKAAAYFRVGWSHYLILMRIENENERSFYEIEAANQNWSVRQLQREYGSSLYERLALSRDKDAVMRLSREGQKIERPQDMLKKPLVLEFLGLAEDAIYTESELESAIISKLSDFLLELGKGFLFEARQKRFTYDEEDFFVDLVFYNRLLQCYVIIDLKTGKLKHQDLGQMQMYVNYFDREVRGKNENPTIGILLCKEQNESVVEMTLPKDANIYASAYSLYLPDKALLKSKLAEWADEFEEKNSSSNDEKDD